VEASAAVELEHAALDAVGPELAVAVLRRLLLQVVVGRWEAGGGR
jgi:hypothetical protein